MDTIRLAVDAESGDFGPRVIISGILEARTLIDTPFTVLLCGNRERIERVVDELDAKERLADYRIVECNDIIDPGKKRANVWKRQTGASIIHCITLQKDGEADASISAGDTAILLGAALFILGRAEGVLRPALAAFLPTVKKRPVLLLDVGANLNCRPDQLVSFARMGERYYGRFMDLASPVVALLNIGKEAVKGTGVIAAVDGSLRQRCGNYYGFIEGNEILAGEADVVVCDGFCGNVLLKVCESFHQLAGAVLGDRMASDTVVRKKMMVLDSENYGAVPFLGIKGTVLKAHGRSSSRAIAHAVTAAITAVRRHAAGEENPYD